MKPERQSQVRLSVTRSKAKMFEYGIPEEHHINITQDPSKLFTISIGMLGDLAAGINHNEFTSDLLAELRSNLIFSARFFDSYLQSRLNEILDPYLVLLASASYYLSDLPGSSSVLVKQIEDDCPDLDGDGLEKLLHWLLQAGLQTYFDGMEGPFGKYINEISQFIREFFDEGVGKERLIDLSMELRAKVYEIGTPRQLLFGDAIVSITKKKLQNACWTVLPLYSGLPQEAWKPALKKETFIKEFWPAQHLLGQSEVLKGRSAVIQMPTSAGKTKATELILRSAFLANRTSLAIVIAPFRALCHEIKDSLTEAFLGESIKVDELSDTPQADFEIAELLGHQQVVVVTPEKLLYVLRYAPELASYVGLMFFDEGHQFDNGIRGITYELLLTSLRSMLSEGTQKVLISAVISNAEAIGMWLNGEPNVVEGDALNPTFKSIGFASWLDQLGRIEYVDSQNAEQGEFFVPRVIEEFNLGRRGRETKDRFFPEKSNGPDIALYLGLKLVKNGSVAIFCGRKTTAANICERAVEIISRGVPLALPSDFSDQHEVKRLTSLHQANLGTSAAASITAGYGIFSHHGNTPHGIRLSVEYAMREGLVCFVICTSTLAQGVNLPIRYLLVTSIYQGEDLIKVRDFHNLIGRAGRAGMHTEGSILFTDPDIYDKRKNWRDGWRWNLVKNFLNPKNSEPCVSNLLSVFEPIRNKERKRKIVMSALDFAKDYIHNPKKIYNSPEKIAKKFGDKGFSKEDIEEQINWKISLINAVESFLLSHWDETENGLSEEDVVSLAEDTLAFFLADEETKEHIRELFKLLAQNISANITEPARRQLYGRTLYGIRDIQRIEKWVEDNANALLSVSSEEEALELAWPLLTQHISNRTFKRFDKPDVLKNIIEEWIDGKPFGTFLEIVRKKDTKMIWGTQRRNFKIDHMVDVCESAFAYDGALLLNALCEFIEYINPGESNDQVGILQVLQKRLKYGLPTETAIAVYELGFSDRVIAQDLVESLNLSKVQRTDIVRELKQNHDEAISIIRKYPLYFQEKMTSILH